MADKDLLVLVGAGASFGQHDKFRPPLGARLAEHLRRKDSRFSAIENFTKVECGEDFEEWISKIGNCPEAFTGSVAVVSHFFRQFKQVHKRSRYYDLISIIGAKNIQRASFVSLNYESLLEIALRRNGYILDWGSSSIKGDRFNSSKEGEKVPFYKPHGSAHFIALLGSGPATPQATTLDLTSKIHMETDVMDPTSMVFHENVLSVISAYEAEKRNPFNNPFVDEIRESTQKAAKSAKTLLVIGVRYIPKDAFLPKVFGSAFKSGLQIGYIGSLADFEGYKAEFESEDVVVSHLGEYFDGSSLQRIEEFLECTM
ncbi:hypothetical protein Q3O59_07535 [Alkalimonas delamerensis]|uniref:SIR2-like domain-containing protein n=1 Tax=Alkalimonas delamerensis TaxID=265981 RepID=A0ABT9GPJ6_9GAMM|nr:hypothetical protein [Alkalimonas delamerensis]MDP4528883.1 hypothetical protein [Alkalimonas delamerensis]